MILVLLLAKAAAVDPLVLAFAAAHRDYSAQLADQFAERTSDSDADGKLFKFVGPLKDGNALGGPPGDAYFTYKNGKLQLVFIPDEKPAGSGYGGPRYLIGVIGGSRKPQRSFVGTNAFGATVRVQVESFDANGLAMFERPAGGANPYMPADVSPQVASYLPQRASYSLDLELPPAEARRVSSDAGLLVEGTLAAFPDGKPSICKPIYIEATVANPLRLYGEECWVGARVRRIAFARRSTGEVLKEWVAAPE